MRYDYLSKITEEGGILRKFFVFNIFYKPSKVVNTHLFLSGQSVTIRRALFLLRQNDFPFISGRSLTDKLLTFYDLNSPEHSDLFTFFSVILVFLSWILVVAPITFQTANRFSVYSKFSLFCFNLLFVALSEYSIIESFSSLVEKNCGSLMNEVFFSDENYILKPRPNTFEKQTNLLGFSRREVYIGNLFSIGNIQFIILPCSIFFVNSFFAFLNHQFSGEPFTYGVIKKNLFLSSLSSAAASLSLLSLCNGIIELLKTF